MEKVNFVVILKLLGSIIQQEEEIQGLKKVRMGLENILENKDKKLEVLEVKKNELAMVTTRM